MTLSIHAIDHIQVTCPPSKEVACIAFYRDALGLTEIEKPEELKSRGGVWFQLGDQQVHLGIDPEGPATPSKRHVCFLVSDLEAAQTVLEAAGIEITPEPIDATGLRRFFVRDPANNRVEIGVR